ncbi:kinesin-like protein KIF3B [Vespa velutina]|uniref:kinesin-like protein KIF3B n=1 Tax=Vespa velutina TaxID=202808 RepID=UPI001FB3C020|nr:kinesin-like protein KIF3B [Vespa velutina]XP_047357458.1 kinesin-like protein KIF3B [Vespa velutina]XP_047357459.1 kinesin-like protein KIF3B [Vespa velutina]XP_047357460.1 kinesin-like protein KIF3B [Vespa velutina]
MDKFDNQSKSSKKKCSRSSAGSADVATQCVQVVVRCRPMDEKETARGYIRVVDVIPSRGVVEIRHPRDDPSTDNVKVFTFDAVYDWRSTQQELYEETVRPLVSSVLDGFNGTIFAYGQTGTGKTYTMEGSKMEHEKRGIIPRSFEHIFNHIGRSENMQYLVRASYLEIYQEEIRDLLHRDQSLRFELKEKPESGVFVKDLSTAVCKSAAEIQRLMNEGNQNRTIGATNMNEHSSRSHAIFLITIEMGSIGDNGGIRVGRLNLVDLAGSERQSKTGASGERLKEASKINLSLSALGNVISALVDGKTTHVPYRDSKLTRLLQDSLGGNSKTIMVANIGPASYNYDETLTTLRYANRAKNIKNKPRINEDPKDALLRQYQEEIGRLKEKLAQRSMVQRKKRKTKKKREDDLADSESDAEDSKGEDNNKTIEVDKKLIAEQLRAEKQETENLITRIKDLESKMLCGGKNIIDHTNEQQRALEQKAAEIAERKKREVEMQQKLEDEELTMVGVRETYTTLQQEVDVKSRKLRKCFTKLQALKQELDDVTNDFNRDRRDLEQTQHELMKELKLKYLIIENFIPEEEKNKILSRIHFDEEEDCWILKNSEASNIETIKRPTSVPGARRPISEYARIALAMGRGYRYAGENILNLDLDMPARTTLDYHGPAIAPTIQAVLEEALRDEGDIDVDASNAKLRSKPRLQSARIRPRSVPKMQQIPTPVYPKTRGLVPK